MKKKALNLLVSEDLVKRAREQGINLSAFLEIRLQEYLALIDNKENLYTPYNIGKTDVQMDTQDTSDDNKTNNSLMDNPNASWACGVAWYPCSFGSYRLEFKSQQAHSTYRITKKRNM